MVLTLFSAALAVPAQHLQLLVLPEAHPDLDTIRGVVLPGLHQPHLSRAPQLGKMAVKAAVDGGHQLAQRGQPLAHDSVHHRTLPALVCRQPLHLAAQFLQLLPPLLVHLGHVRICT